METYPIVFDGRRTGTLEVSREGLMTTFRAALPDDGELVRLSVYGEGLEGYLGVMVPDGQGNLCLTRRMSRAALAAFPWDIDHAGPPGEMNAAPSAPGAQARSPEPKPAKAVPGEEDLLWFAAPDGSLAAFDGRRTLVALPARDVRTPMGAESVVRYINGREYVVFPW